MTPAHRSQQFSVRVLLRTQLPREAGAVVVAAIEGEEPGGVALELGAEHDLLIVEGEMDGAAAGLEEGLFGGAVALVLADGVIDGLLGEVVFELEGSDGETVDEQGEIEGELRLVDGVAELAGDGEAVRLVIGEGAVVPGGGRAVEEVDVGGGLVADALAEDVDDAAPGDLAPDAGEEGDSAWAWGGEVEPLDDVGLGAGEEGEELSGVEGVVTVVVGGGAEDVTHGGVGLLTGLDRSAV